VVPEVNIDEGKEDEMNNDGDIQQKEMDVDTGTDVEDNVDDELGPDSDDDVAADSVEEPAKKKRKTRHGFVCECPGMVMTEIMKPDKNADGYWQNHNLINQMKVKAMPTIRLLHPGCDLHSGFDNSQNHHARAPDYLYVHNLNLNDGGKNVQLLRDT
jgi:hypothetical protein